MDYKRNAKYFKRIPRIPAKVFLGFIIIMGVLFAMKPIIPISVLILLVVAFVLLYCGAPSDNEIDEQAAGMLDGIKARAFAKLGIDEEEIAMAQPLEFWGYNFNNVLPDDANRKAWNVCGKDGLWRSSEITIGGFYFSENVIHYYWRTASLVSDASKEGTEEYYYKDVVSVKTSTDDIPFKNPKTGEEDTKKRVRTASFVLRNSGGESTSCWVKDIAMAEAAVNAFRALLKQKKLEQ